MTYQTILVHCDDGRQAVARTELAAALAERHQAHLIGLHVRPPFQPPVYDNGSFAMGMMFKDHEDALVKSEIASSKIGRHGVKVSVQRDAAPDADVGSLILSRAMDHGCDIIVMGIYGHSRLRELVLGGASRTVLASMTVPVLMAH